MKLDINTVSGELSLEKHPKCEILRCIYYFSRLYPNNCLLRIYKFRRKTIVITSQLHGAVLWDDFLIKCVIEDFQLNSKNLYWINHVGLFSDYMPAIEKFLHTTFTFQKESLFSPKNIKLIKENEISLENVENLIESSLEPVDFWLGLDPRTREKIKQERDEKIFKLLYLYLQTNLKYLSEHEVIKKALLQSSPSAIFFYPNQNKYIEYVKYSEIVNDKNALRKKALPYIHKSFPDRDIVICVCLEDFSPFCTILSKEIFISEAVEIGFDSIEKLIEFELEASNVVELDLKKYQVNEQKEQERTKKLLELYLEPNFSYFISKFEQIKHELEQIEYKFRDKREPNIPLRGALFYYPEVKLEDQQKYTYFFKQQDLKNSYKHHEKSALPYVNRYDVEREVVICVQIDEYESVCGIFPRTHLPSVKKTE